MPNLLTRGATWLASRLQAAAGRTVTYSRGPLDSEPITAWMAEHEYEVLNEEGFLANALYYDWTFIASEILIRGSLIVPRDGDRITETVNSVAVAYEVRPLDNEPCFKRLDTGGHMLLVHTRLVS